MRWPPLEERFWAKVQKGGADECWPWTAALYGNGYGAFNFRGKTNCAHRAAYEMLVGPIPKGMDLDHLCRNRRCVNPAHLEPVSRRENLLRSPITLTAQNAARTHCVKGHEFTPENTWIRPDNGGRCCKACWKVQAEAKKAKACIP